MYEHVGVDGHAEREQKSGYSRHGEHRLERGHYAQREEQVEQQRHVGHHSRNEVVEHNEVGHQYYEGDDERHEALLDGLHTERRAHHLFLHDAGRGGHLARVERVGQVFGLLDGEVSCDLGASAGNLAVHSRRAVHGAVEHDGHRAAYVGLGELRPAARSVAVHLHGDAGVAHLVESVAGVGYHVALKRGAA